MKKIAVAGFAALVSMMEIPYAGAGVELPVPYLQQPDDQTCLPTCLTMALHFMGRVDLTSETVFKFQPRTNYDRYNVPGILKEYGLYALPSWYERGWTRKTIEHELDCGRPVILGCNQGPAGHFVLAIGYTDDGRLIINDPSAKTPGYEIGGPRSVIRWEQLLWRGGVIIRADELPTTPTISGSCVESTSPRRMICGETTTAVFAIKNNGSQSWPAEVFLCPIEPETSPTQFRRSAFEPPGAWISSSRICAADRKAIAPGEVANFAVPLRAPMVDKPKVFMEHWNMVDGSGRAFSSSYLAGPGDYQIFTRVCVEPATTFTLPLIETVANGRPALDWIVKKGRLEVANDVPATTDGATILKLATAGARYDSAWVGNGDWRDYRVEALVYCDYRPELEKKGFDRVGIFIRDNGDHAGDTKDGVELGETYAMTFDTDDGGIRAAYVENGGIRDFRRGPRYTIKESGWHRFAIRCAGDELVYELDGREFWRTRDRMLTSGDCGVYYKAGFDDLSLSRGLRFADFKATR
ncbi:MAG: C39 family peptidase [Candidatus Sumerlaeaceae bacterium]|nr:C39 family peptidase [Candidatus Sumerlaeaceae bacterium]